MKKIFILSLTAILLIVCVACAKPKEEAINMELKTSQMRAICELATMDCYYHTVAKYNEKLDNFWPWEAKIKRFWIEYGGVVRLGIDASLVVIDVKDTNVSITMPEAKILHCRVDSDTLSKRSFIVDKESEKPTAQDELKAYDVAEKKLAETASNDKALLTCAKERAMELLKGYVLNVGRVVGKEYNIHWIFVDKDGNPIES